MRNLKRRNPVISTWLPLTTLLSFASYSRRLSLVALPSGIDVPGFLKCYSVWQTHQGRWEIYERFWGWHVCGLSLSTIMLASPVTNWNQRERRPLCLRNEKKISLQRQNETSFWSKIHFAAPTRDSLGFVSECDLWWPCRRQSVKANLIWQIHSIPAKWSRSGWSTKNRFGKNSTAFPSLFQVLWGVTMECRSYCVLKNPAAMIISANFHWRFAYDPYENTCCD